MWQIRYGLGGGFGGCESQEWIDLPGVLTESDAIDQAYNAACELYEQYDGLHGLRSLEQIMEEDECDENEASSIWHEERESWLDYEAQEVKD